MEGAEAKSTKPSWFLQQFKGKGDGNQTQDQLGTDKKILTWLIDVCDKPDSEIRDDSKVLFWIAT